MLIEATKSRNCCQFELWSLATPNMDPCVYGMGSCGGSEAICWGIYHEARPRRRFLHRWLRASMDGFSTYTSRYIFSQLPKCIILNPGIFPNFSISYIVTILKFGLILVSVVNPGLILSRNQLIFNYVCWAVVDWAVNKWVPFARWYWKKSFTYVISIFWTHFSVQSITQHTDVLAGSIVRMQQINLEKKLHSKLYWMVLIQHAGLCQMLFWWLKEITFSQM